MAVAPPPPLHRGVSTFALPEGKLAPHDMDVGSILNLPGNMWVVAVDGSDLSLRALRLACFLMNPKLKTDSLCVLHIVKEMGVDADSLEKQCKAEAQSCGVLSDIRGHNQFAFKTVVMPNGWEAGDVLVYFTNHIGLFKKGTSGTRLVLGAQGADAKGGEGKMANLGHIATQCLAKVKVPTITVSRAWQGLNGEQTNLLGRKARVGKDQSSGVKIVVCVDDTHVSEVAFDKAVSVARKGDTLVALHVVGTYTDRAMTERVKSHFDGECGKVAASKGIQCDLQVYTSKESLTDAVLDATCDADLLVMGSVELGDMRKRKTLGSNVLGVAKGTRCHLCVVKQLSG